MALTQEKALAAWTQVQHLISVGAYTERSAEHYETDTWPEDSIEETAFNLEEWAREQGLQFVWNLGSHTWFLAKIAYGPEPESE
jgi:hypothetical protein